ncbi:MAG: cytochrome c maturation protein CcmE [Deferribacteraceae bacterium]|nr:cytochrome c maturation protein CcmE [Deferribacteraceae bacterium]
MKNYVKYTVAFALVAAALLYLVLSGFDGDKVYYLEVSELLTADKTELAKGLRVAGYVTENIAAIDRLNKVAKFEMSESPHGEGSVINCEYYGSIPDGLEEGASVVVEGSFDPSQNLFTAKKLLAKCPSKYEVEVPPGESAAAETISTGGNIQ